MTNASGLDSDPLNSPTEDFSQALWPSKAAAAHSDTATGAEPAETGEGSSEGAGAAPSDHAEQQAPQKPSAASPVGTTLLSSTPSQAAGTSREVSASSQPPPQHGTPPGQPTPSSTVAEPGSSQEHNSVAELDNGHASQSKSPSKPSEEHAAATTWSSEASTSQSEASAGDAHTAGSLAQSGMAREVDPTPRELNRESSWASDVVPADTTYAEAAPPPAVGAAASADVDSAGSSPQAHGQSAGLCRTDEAGAQQPSTDVAASAHQPSTASESHMSTDQSLSPLEMQAGNAESADAIFAEVPTSVDTGMLTDDSSRSSQQALAVPSKPQADDSQWDDDAFAAATAAPHAEQAASFDPAPQGDVAVTVPDTTAASPQAAASHSFDWAEEPSVLPPAPQAELPTSTAAAGEDGTAAGASVSEQAAEQQADEDDWGDDDFGDFNDAASAGDDGGFGEFNEADTTAPSAAGASVPSFESQQQNLQPSLGPAGMCWQDCPCLQHEQAHVQTRGPLHPMHNLHVIKMYTSTAAQHGLVLCACTQYLALTSSTNALHVMPYESHVPSLQTASIFVPQTYTKLNTRHSRLPAACPAIEGQVHAALHMCLPCAPHADILSLLSSHKPCHVDAVPQEAPQPSLLSRLLNAPQQDLPGMLSQVFSPLTEPFARLPPISELPINPGGSQLGWRYNGQALLEHHMQQAKQLPVGDVLPTGGLLGQPPPGRECPAAPSLTRSKVKACTAVKRPVSLPSC